MKRTIVLNAKDANLEDIATTISNANPEATDSQLYNAVVALNSLTENTFVSAKKIDETEILPLTVEGGAA